MLTLAPTLGANVAGAIPVEADGIDPSTLGSADNPRGPNSDDSATKMVLCDVVGPMIPAPVIPVQVIPGDADP